MIAAGLFFWGVYSVQVNKIDAIPDLSENQVIVFTLGSPCRLVINGYVI